MVGSWPPRRCGIATFGHDLLEAVRGALPGSEGWAVALDDRPEGHAYGPEVRFQIDDRSTRQHRAAAEFLDMNGVDAVFLQHEFGIYGGEFGVDVLELLGGLTMPVITTLHTVLDEPDEQQRAILRRIGQLSDRVVTMTPRSAERLRDVYDVPGRKIVVVPHGIPDLPFVDPNFYKDGLGVEGRRVILTFGLLSPGKGVETMIRALPSVVDSHPEVVYAVVGATHPHVRRDHGESYRLSLQRLVEEFGLTRHVLFHDRFVPDEEVAAFVGAADVYVTPYPSAEQAVSGTLAYALGAGKAIVSTPYAYAEEMLAGGRGRLVPFCDPEALAEALCALLDDDAERHAMRKRAYRFARGMVWSEVGRAYLAAYDDVRRERAVTPPPPVRRRRRRDDAVAAPEPTLRHIARLTDDTGLLQHAIFTVPNREHGYCTDDNARALTAAVLAPAQAERDSPGRELAPIYLSFLHHAFHERVGRFRNFMAFDRRWLDEAGSDDSNARAVAALGLTTAQGATPGLRAAAQALFERALPGLASMTSPRAWAIALVGLDAYLARFGGDREVWRLQRTLAERLFEGVRECAEDGWRWPEEILTYANARIPEGLIVAGRALGRQDMVSTGAGMLGWLLEVQTDVRGHFVPIGNRGWYPRGGQKARFDQQPIEAQATIDACLAAFEATRNDAWLVHAHTCGAWFLGRNDLAQPLFDASSGGCRDGLAADGPNGNQGAESTLACFLSLLQLQRLGHHRALEALPGPSFARPRPELRTVS